MKQISEHKSSSRSGRFKKKLVTLDHLSSEAPLIEARMAPFLALDREQKISGPELVTIYLLLVLSHRYPKGWAGSKTQLQLPHKLQYPLSDLLGLFEVNIRKRFSEMSTVGDVIQNFALRATPLPVARSLLRWSTTDYQLVLMQRIPTPAEVLAQQSQGRRCVTLLTQARQTQKYILGERDALSFTLHDLIHADHFYHHNNCFEAQVDFYDFINRCFIAGDFNPYLKLDDFMAEFEYVISDMNAYPVHLWKCLKSAMIHYHPEGREIFDSWIKSRVDDQEAREALQVLNTPSHRPELHDGRILAFFTRQSP